MKKIFALIIVLMLILTSCSLGGSQLKSFSAMIIMKENFLILAAK